MKKVMALLITFIILISINANAKEISVDYKELRLDSSEIISVAYNGDVCVAVGENGLICVSNDLKNWTDLTGVSYNDIFQVLLIDNEFYCFTVGHTFTSSDGYNWQEKALKYEVDINQEIQKIQDTYYVNVYVKKDDGNKESRLSLTTDFVNFELLEYKMNKIWEANGKLFSLISFSDYNYSLYQYAGNDVWNKSLPTQNLQHITYQNGKYLAYYIQPRNGYKPEQLYA